MLEGLMQLTVYGPDICTDQCDDLITSSVKNWLQTKYRRKLLGRNKAFIKGNK
jgi:disulfide oxidoreductase YuzD